MTGSLLLGGAGPPWIPRGDGEEEEHHKEPRAFGLEEMTPSAFRKWLRISSRQPESAQVQAALMMVRAVSRPEEGDSPSSSPSPLPPQVVAMKATYPKVFEEAEGVEANPPVRHPIRLQDDAKPSHVKPYRFSETQKNEIKEQVSLLLHKGWVRPSSSPWGAPVLLVPKKDGT